MRIQTCVRHARTYADNVHRVFSVVCLAAIGTFIIVAPLYPSAMSEIDADDVAVDVNGTEVNEFRAEEMLSTLRTLSQYAPNNGLRLDAGGISSDDYAQFDGDYDSYVSVHFDDKRAIWAPIEEAIDAVREAIEEAEEEETHPAIEMLEGMDSVVDYSDTYAYVDLDGCTAGSSRISHPQMDIERAERADRHARDEYDADMYVRFELLDE